MADGPPVPRNPVETPRHCKGVTYSGEFVPEEVKAYSASMDVDEQQLMPLNTPSPAHSPAGEAEEMEDSFAIHVRMEDGLVITLDIRASDTVLTLKNKLRATPEGAQRIHRRLSWTCSRCRRWAR